MQRKIIMGLLAFGVVAGFGSELRRSAWGRSCGSSCADYEQKSTANLSAATPSVEGQTKNAHKKGEHCGGWKGRWQWGQQEEKAPEAPITTAQNQ